MYLKHIQLKNLRGFANLQFDLSRPGDQYAGWTVFTGDNGSGKSTLLRAVAVALVGPDTARSLQPSFNRWIRQGAEEEESSIRLEVVRTVEDDELTGGGAPPTTPFPAQITLVNGGKETGLQTQGPPGKRKNYATPARTLWAPDARGWFSCGYGPFRRISGASAEAARQMVAPMTGRFVTMFQEAASLAEVDEWLRKLKHKEHENKVDERQQLGLVLRLLSDDLMPSQITVDRVDSDGLWLRDREGVQLAWDDMSDGYRSAAALLADILRHLLGTYGLEGLTGITPGGQTYIRRSGVVLIDEIDAHLHPAWQRQIGFWLKQHFPHIQFLVTTHSPLICQAADPNGLFVLPHPGSGDEPRPLTDEEYRQVISSRPDTILLSPAFGLQNTRSPRAVEGRGQYAKLQAKRQSGARLTAEERRLEKQLELFACNDEPA